MSPRATTTTPANAMESKLPTTIVTERLESPGVDDAMDSPQLVRPVSSLASSPRLQAQRRWPNAPSSPQHATRCADISVDEIVTPLMTCGAGVVSAFETFKANCQKSPLRYTADTSETRGPTNSTSNSPSPFAGVKVPAHIERLAAGSEEACVHIADNIQAKLGNARRASDGIIDMACLNINKGGAKAAAARAKNSSPSHGGRMRRGPSDNGLGVPSVVATSQSFVYTLGDAANLARDFDNNSFQSKNSALTLDTAAQEDLEYDLYRLQRMTSWATLGTGGTVGTGGTTQTGGTNDTMSTEVNADDDGREIPAELQKIRRRRTRRRRVVKFEYPPISSLKEYPRSDPRDREILFFTEDELDQLEEDRMSTTTADDVEIVAVPASYEEDDVKQLSSKKKATSHAEIDDSLPPPPRNAFDRSDSLGGAARGLASPSLNSSFGELGATGSNASAGASTPSPLASMEDRPSPRQHHRNGRVALGVSPPPSPVCTESGSTAGGSATSPHGGGGGGKGSWRSPKRGVRRAPTPGPTPRLSTSSSSSSIRSDQATNPNSPAAVGDHVANRGSRGWGRRGKSRNKSASKVEANDNKSTSSAPADVDVSPRSTDAVGMVITTQAHISPEPSSKMAPFTPVDQKSSAATEEAGFDEDINDIPKAGARKEDGGAPLSPFEQQRLRRRAASFNGRAGSSMAHPPTLTETARSEIGTPRSDRPVLKGVQIYMRQRSLG